MGVATIGSALVEKRLELGLDKRQVAEIIGMSRTTYSSYEQDSQRPSVDVFPALAKFLEISTEKLLTLYGATCVAAIRSSLERVVSDDGGRGKVPGSAEEPVVPDEGLTIETDLASKLSVVTSETLESEESEELLEFPDVRTAESFSRHREVGTEEPVIVESIVTEPSLVALTPVTPDRPKKNSGNKKNKKKKQKNR
jgi:transcriptional regulator with XRE-family HTH domain